MTVPSGTPSILTVISLSEGFPPRVIFNFLPNEPAIKKPPVFIKRTGLNQSFVFQHAITYTQFGENVFGFARIFFYFTPYIGHIYS